MARRRQLWFAFFASHLLLATGVSAWETVWLVGHSSTILPRRFADFCRNADTIDAGTNTKKAASTEPAQQALNTYLHLAGIEAGYGFFAPNVPDSYKLSFALSYPDGHRAILSAEAGRAESNLRLASLTDYIGRTTSDIVREDMIKLLAYSAWRQHQDVTDIRALLLRLIQPTPEEFLQGQRSTYEAAYEYDFAPAQLSPRASPQG